MNIEAAIHGCLTEYQNPADGKFTETERLQVLQVNFVNFFR